jgi:hypothetical protein
MLKDLERDETCPLRFKGLWIDKAWKSEPNAHMLFGLYFESLALGGSANDEQTFDLPRLKNGEKSSKQIRIEEQAERFKELFDPEHKDFLGYKIISDQDYIEHNGRAGTLDFIAVDEEGRICIFDLKMTGTLEWKQAWWYDIDTVDLFQQYHYHKLYEDTHEGVEGLRNFLIIFDYTPRKNVVVYELFPDKLTANEVDERFDALDKVIELYNEKGWITVPSEKECAGCPLKCNNRIKPIE